MSEDQSVGAHLDDVLREQADEIRLMREALRIERARSEFLWDRALQRELITEEEWVSARDPDRERHQQEAFAVKRQRLVEPA